MKLKIVSSPQLQHNSCMKHLCCHLKKTCSHNQACRKYRKSKFLKWTQKITQKHLQGCQSAGTCLSRASKSCSTHTNLFTVDVFSNTHMNLSTTWCRIKWLISGTTTSSTFGLSLRPVIWTSHLGYNLRVVSTPVGSERPTNCFVATTTTPVGTSSGSTSQPSTSNQIAVTDSFLEILGKATPSSKTGCFPG